MIPVKKVFGILVTMLFIVAPFGSFVPAEAASLNLVQDKAEEAIDCAVEYEAGNMNILQLRACLHQAREGVNEVLSQKGLAVKLHEQDTGVSSSAVKQILGEPNDKTQHGWDMCNERETRFDERVPWWEKSIFSGDKIIMTLNAWPHLDCDGNIFYRLEFQIRTKADMPDISSCESRVKSLAQGVLSGGGDGEELMSELMSCEAMASTWLEQYATDCENAISNYFSSSEKVESQKIERWEVTLSEGDKERTVLVLDTCLSCKWPWTNVRVEAHMNQQDGFKQFEDIDKEQYRKLEESELKSRFSSALSAAVDSAQNIGNVNFQELARANAEMDVTMQALSEKAYWGREPPHNAEHDALLNFLESEISRYGQIDREETIEQRWERPLIEDIMLVEESWCQSFKEPVRCDADESCAEGLCVPNIVGEKDCQNGEDDDGDRAIDMADRDCGGGPDVCEPYCEDCWKERNNACSDICEGSCRECEKSGKEDCQSECRECWSCNNKIQCSDECQTCEAERDCSRNCGADADCYSKCIEDRAPNVCQDECNDCWADINLNCGEICESSGCWGCGGEGCDSVCTECWPCQEKVSCPDSCRQCEAERDCSREHGEGTAEYDECMQNRGQVSGSEECKNACQALDTGADVKSRCKDWCSQGVQFICGGKAQSTPCSGIIYDCSLFGGSLQPIPCQIFECVSGKQTEPCTEGGIICSEGYEYDKEVNSCVATELKKEVCDNTEDDDDDFYIDCDDSECWEDASCKEEEDEYTCVDGNLYRGNELMEVCLENSICDAEKRVCVLEGCINVTCELYECRDDGLYIGSCDADTGECVYELHDECGDSEVCDAEKGECSEEGPGGGAECSDADDCPADYVCAGLDVKVCQEKPEECPIGAYCVELPGNIFKIFDKECEVPEEGNFVDMSHCEEQVPDCAAIYCARFTCKDNSLYTVSCNPEKGQCEPESLYEECPEGTVCMAGGEEGECVSEEKPTPPEPVCMLACPEGEYLIADICECVPEEEPEQKEEQEIVVEESGEETIEEESEPEVEEPISMESVTGEASKSFWEWLTAWASMDDEQKKDDDQKEGDEKERWDCTQERDACSNPQQYCDEESGDCRCEDGWYECNGDWLDGCETEVNCYEEGACTEERCAQPRCAEWEPAIINFGCYVGGSHEEDKNMLMLAGSCSTRNGETQPHIHFDIWGEAFDRVQQMRYGKESVYSQSWCKYELEGLKKQRDEIESALDTKFMDWFFNDYVKSNPSEWDRNIGALWDVYWFVAETNVRIAVMNDKCSGNVLSLNPISLEYTSEFGDVSIKEEWVNADTSVMDEGGKRVEALAPYMEIWIFPPKDILKAEFQKAQADKVLMGPPEEQKTELSYIDQQAIQDEVGGITQDLRGKSIMMTIRDSNEEIYRLLMSVDESNLLQIQPGTERQEAEITVDIDYNFLYELVNTMEKDMRGAEIVSPEWAPEKGGAGLKKVTAGMKIMTKFITAGDDFRTDGISKADAAQLFGAVMDSGGGESRE